MADKIGYQNMIIDVSTGEGKQATITVYDAGTLNISTIYSDSTGTPLANPFSTDANGRFNFYADPGEYDIKVSGVGITTYTIEDVTIVGPSTYLVGSNPQSGEYRIKAFRLDATGRLVIVYDSVPEP